MEKEKVVISGVNGFVGHHLARELFNSGVLVAGIGRERNINPDISSIISEYHQADLVKEWPDMLNTKAVIHLAGLAAVGPSFDSPQVYIDTNSAIVTNMCEYYLKQDKKPRVIIVSSGSVYDSSQSMPISESGEIRFSSPYVVSKILNENQAVYYRNRGLDCVVVRPLNHIGPGQNTGFILPDLYSRLSSLSENENEIITGNIETRRDYTDVRDIARAYGKIALAESLKYRTYNICSGRSLSGVDIFNTLKSAMNLDYVNYKVDQSLIRPSDIKDIVGDSSHLREELGWEPQISIQQTIADFVESNQ